MLKRPLSGGALRTLRRLRRATLTDEGLVLHHRERMRGDGQRGFARRTATVLCIADADVSAGCRTESQFADSHHEFTRLTATVSSRCIAALTRTLLPREKPVHQSQAHDAPHRLAVFPFIKAFPCHATHPTSTIRVQK